MGLFASGSLLLAAPAWPDGCTPPGTGGNGGTGGAPEICGNGIREGYEPCDGNDFGTQTCVGISVYTGGTLRCESDCRLDTSQCTVPVACGNAVKDGTEQCDIDSYGEPILGAATCKSVVAGSAGGTLACNPLTCRFDTSGCSNANVACGDGIVNGAEECDGSALGVPNCAALRYEGGSLSCNTETCKLDISRCTPLCGNGVLEASEQCEGTNVRGDTCQAHGFLFGQVTCTPQCTVDYLGCTGGCFWTRFGLTCR